MSGLPLFLALLLAVSAGHKALDRARLAPVAARLASVPAWLGAPLLLAAAALEAAAAIAMALAPLRPEGALAGAAIWLAYGLALLRRRGEVLDCGCDLVRRERPVGTFAIGRPLLLALLAAGVAALPPAGFSADAPFAALGLIALWFAAAELSHLPRRERKAP